MRVRPTRPGWLKDAILLAALMLLALAGRSVNLGAYSGLFDEGIRAEQLYLMSLGYRPFKDIFAAQGPLLLDSLYPVYAIFHLLLDQPLVEVRMVAVTYSLIGLAGLYWIGRQLGGPIAGFAAALVLVLSPLYLEGSRLALAEVPALAPAILAIGCALRYQRTHSTRWMAASGLLLTLSLLMKPITLAAAPAVALAALSVGRRGLRDLVVVGAGTLLLSLVIVWLLGFSSVQDQILAYRGAAREAADWSLRKNLQAVRTGLSLESTALLPLALLGTCALLVKDWKRALPIFVWGIGGLLLLLSYSPLHGKHIVLAIPALALLAGAGSVRAWQALSAAAPANRQLLAAGPFVLAAAWYASTLLPLVGQTGQLLRVTADTDVDPAFDQYNDAVTTLQALSAPDDFVLTDQPYLAFLAERKVPPELVDTALSRIRSRSLTGRQAQNLAAAYDPKLVLLWGDRLRSLPTFKTWVEQEYQLIKVYSRRQDTDRALYLRRGADFAAARKLISPSLGSPQATFGDIRLSSAALDPGELRVGQGLNVTLCWEQVARTSVDYHVLLELRGADGRSADDQEESLGGGSDGTSHWEPGRWLVQRSFLKTDQAAPGQYSVIVAIYDSRARTRIAAAGDDRPSEIVIGAVTVR